MKDEIDDQLSIRCYGCKERLPLGDSISTGWQMCQVCSNFFCLKCFREIIEQKKKACSGSIGMEAHQIVLVNIPRGELLLFAEKEITPKSTDPAIFELFFKERFEELTSTGTSLAEIKKKEKIIKVEEGPAVLRQEHWRTQGLVLVQRRRGKYVTWETIGGV